jgi:hypothetical protein
MVYDPYHVNVCAANDQALTCVVPRVREGQVSFDTRASQADDYGVLAVFGIM